MGYISFSEYVEKNKGAKAKVALVADYDGPSKDSPEVEKKHDDAGGSKKGQHGKLAPYKSGKDAPDPNKKTEKGLGHHGGKDYHKDIKDKAEKELGSYPKIKTHEWLQKTKNLSLAEFTKNIRNERFRGLEEDGILSTNSLSEAVAICKRNENYITDLVLQLKRNDLFEVFCANMFLQAESFEVLKHLAENDNTFARKLVITINEMIAPPMGSENEPSMEDDEEEDEDDDEDFSDDEDGDEGDDDEGDDDLEDDDSSDEEGDESDMGSDDEQGMPQDNPMAKAMKENPSMMKHMMNMMGYK